MKTNKSRKNNQHWSSLQKIIRPVVYQVVLLVILMILMCVIVWSNNRRKPISILTPMSSFLAFYTVFVGLSNNVSNVVYDPPTRKFDSYFFSNNHDTLKRAKEKGWIPVFLTNTTVGLGDESVHNIEAKHVKVLPHLYPQLTPYMWTLFFDSKRKINAQKIINFIIHRTTPKDSLFMCRHYFRKPPNLDNELKDSYVQPRYVEQRDKINKYVQFRRDTYARDITDADDRIFYMGGIILRNMRHPMTRVVNEMWWNEINACCIQDQVSLYFVSIEHASHIKELPSECLDKSTFK